jgi:hypothetical protein
MLIYTVVLTLAACNSYCSFQSFCSDDEGGVISPDLLGTGGKISMVEMASFAMNPASQTEVCTQTCHTIVLKYCTQSQKL